MTRINRPTSGPIHRARAPSASPRERRNAANATHSQPTGLPFTLDRKGREVLSLDGSLEIRNNQLAVKMQKPEGVEGALTRTKSGIVLETAATLTQATGKLAIVPTAVIADMASGGVSAAQCRDKINAVLAQFRLAGFIAT